MADHRLTNAVEVASGITDSHLVNDLLDWIADPVRTLRGRTVSFHSAGLGGGQ
jgi:hypothetical protein